MTNTPNKVLANLSARGASVTGGTSDHKRFVVLADDQGRLDTSWLTGFTPVGTPLTQTLYVDPTNGNDTNDGGAGSPIATIAEGLTRFSDEVVFILSPGSYGNVTITDTAQTRVAFVGVGGKDMVTLGTITFNNGQLTNTVNLIGVTTSTVSTAVGGGSLNGSLQGGAVPASFVSAVGGNVLIYPGSSVATVVNVGRTYVVDASTTNFLATVPTDWDAVHNYVQDALDELAARGTVLEDTALRIANNLSDVADADTALGNLGGIKTATNVGTAGVEVLKGKNGLTLEFKKLNALSAKIVITDNVGSDQIDLDVDVSKTDVGLGNVQNTLNNYSATSPPDPSNDSSEGYSVGSVWIDTSSGIVYTCIVSTVGAAVWFESGSGGHVIKSGATTFDQRDNMVFDDQHFVVSDNAIDESTDVSLKPTAFAQTFTQFSLFAGYLIVDHLLEEQVVSVTVADSNYDHREVNVNFETTDRLVVDLRGVAVVGTWYVKVIRAGGAGSGLGEGGGGDGLVVGDRVTVEHIVSAGDVAAGYFTLPAAAKFPDKVNVYADGIRQMSAFVSGVTNPDFDVVNTDEIHFNNNGTPSVTLTEDIVENDVLEIVMDVV